MGSWQVQPPTKYSSSPWEDEEARHPEEAAAAASAAPAASLPTLRLRTLEEPPPPPAAAGGPLVRARTDPLFPLLPRSRCACSLSRNPPPSDSQRAPKLSPSSSRRAELARLAASRVRPQWGGGKRSLRY